MENRDGAVNLIILLVGLLIYFLPSLIGGLRQVRNTGSIIVINLFLGWTFIGWVVALAMAFRSVEE